jgi:hypothetical protein
VVLGIEVSKEDFSLRRPAPSNKIRRAICTNRCTHCNKKYEKTKQHNSSKVKNSSITEAKV